MSAPISNTNAEKWNRDKTLALLKDVEHYLATAVIPLITKAVRFAGANRNSWAYLKKKWKDDEEISERFVNLEEDFENKLMEGAMMRRFQWSSVRFILETKYRAEREEKEKEEEEINEVTRTKAEEGILTGRKLTPKELKIQRLLAAQQIRRRNDGKDFSPRDTDGPTLAASRARAYQTPAMHSSTVPNEPYIKFCDDLFAYIG